MRLAKNGLAALLGALAACCAGSGPGTGPARDPMAEIRALEAEIEEGAVSTAGADCEAGGRAAEAICDASRRICALAGELADMEAMGSCRRSEAACQEARRRVAERCDRAAP